MRGYWLFVAAFLAIDNSASAQAIQPPAPTNEWPDPNYCIQDTSKIIPAIHDALPGATPAINVAGYMTGLRTVIVNISSTSNSLVDRYISFASSRDEALRARRCFSCRCLRPWR